MKTLIMTLIFTLLLGSEMVRAEGDGPGTRREGCLLKGPKATISDFSFWLTYDGFSEKTRLMSYSFTLDGIYHSGVNVTAQVSEVSKFPYESEACDQDLVTDEVTCIQFRGRWIYNSSGSRQEVAVYPSHLTIETRNGGESNELSFLSVTRPGQITNCKN